MPTLPSNTLNGLSLTVISQMALQALVARRVKLGAFTTDFSADVAEKGAAVTTRIPSAVVPQDSTTQGYGPQNTTTTAKTITLSNAINRTLSFNDKEVSTISLATLQSIIPTAIADLVNSVQTGVLGNVTSGNFPYNISLMSGSQSVFKGSSVASGVQILNSGNVPEENRWAILAPEYYNALMSDTNISQAYALGSTSIIQDGKIIRLFGANVDYTKNVTTATTTAEGVKGFVSTPDALLLAARVPALPLGFPGEVVNVVDDQSQLGLQGRLWYDATAGTTNLSFGIIYGSSVGNSGSLVRYTDKQ